MLKGLKETTSIFMIIMLALTGTSCGHKSVSNTNGVSVKTVVVNKHKIQSTIDVSGVLNASQTANVAMKAGGKIESLNGDVGKVVNAGDILATIETKEPNVQLQQAKNSVEAALGQAEQARINLDAAEKSYNATKKLLADQEYQAKINLDLAERTYKTAQEKVQNLQLPQSDLEDIKSKYELAQKQYDMARVDTGTSAQNQLLAAKSKYDLAVQQYNIASGSSVVQAKEAVNAVQVQLDNAVLKSPINGVIINKNISVGEIASPGATLFTIADITILKLKGIVPQEGVSLVKQGQEMNIAVDIYPDRTFKGNIETVGPMAVSTGEYFPIEISIKNPGELKAGLSAHGTVEIITNENVCVPVESIIQNNGQNYVFTVKNNIASKRKVLAGFKSDKEMEILKGIEASESVVTTNVNTLVDNMPVTTNGG